MVSVGDHDVVRTDGSRDGGHPARVAHSFERVNHPIELHRTDGLARFVEERGESGCERESPHRRQVGARRTCEVEAVGLGLRCGALVGEHPAGPFVDHFEGTDHARRSPLPPRLIGEIHAVDGERRSGIESHDTAIDPVAQDAGGGVVTTRTVGFHRHVDVHDVVWMTAGQFGPVGVGEHVVGRSHHGLEVAR